MEHFVYGIVILALAGLSFSLWFREHRKFAVVSREKDEIEIEERRMFGFLHGLGEKLQVDNSPANMHRYIVDGVAEVISADNGILYLLDGDSSHLIPVYQTKKTAPVVPVPSQYLALPDQDKARRLYRSFVRSSAATLEGSLMGDSFSSDEFTYIKDMGALPAFEKSAELFHGGRSFLGVSLIYGQKRVGVLAMTRAGGGGFSLNDQEVFSSVAEQSSFALGSAIIHAEAAEKRRLEQELNQASEIQRVLLPQHSPELTDYEIAAGYQAARIVSGDYYDYLRVDEDRYGIAIGDVSGKGIAASLIMAMCRSNLRSRAADNLSPASVLHAVNRSIFPDIKEDMFVSLLYLILERGSNEVTLARAGHEPPVLFRQATKTIEMIEPPGLAAGIDEGPVFKRSVKDFRFRMESGDILLLYTDGLIESEAKDGDEFGSDRLCEAVKKYCALSSEDLVSTIRSDVAEFSAGMAQTDDITLIAIEKR
jgi:sigma-B regulation protein RsbU (phosphoserine phosphatase)